MAEKKNYDFVDALRGWAILGVITFHLNYLQPPPVEFLRNIFVHGERGVQLFFIISAFTLFLSFRSRSKDEDKPVRNFFVRRMFRIIPLYYAAIILYFILYQFSPRLFTTETPSVFDFITNGLFLHGWFLTSINSVVPGGWSIGVEMSFYIILPLLFVLITDFDKAIFITFVAVILGNVLNIFALRVLSLYFPGYLIRPFLFFWLPSQLGVFCLGILLYFMFKRISPNEPNNKFKSYAYLIVALVWLIEVGRAEKSFLPEHFLFSLGLLAFAYSLALYPQTFFVNRLTTNIGKWSYSMYLVHFGVLDFLHRIFPEMKLLSSGTLNFFIFLFLTISITALISVITYSFIEKPSIRLGQEIIARLEATRLPASEVSGS